MEAPGAARSVGPRARPPARRARRSSPSTLTTATCAARSTGCTRFAPATPFRSGGKRAGLRYSPPTTSRPSPGTCGRPTCWTPQPQRPNSGLSPATATTTDRTRCTRSSFQPNSPTSSSRACQESSTKIFQFSSHLLATLGTRCKGSGRAGRRSGNCRSCRLHPTNPMSAGLDHTATVSTPSLSSHSATPSSSPSVQSHPPHNHR
jgi:hypothetical protein